VQPNVTRTNKTSIINKEIFSIMADGKKFVPGKGMVSGGKAAPEKGAKKEAVPPKKGAMPPKKGAAPKKKK
jgi:hypothetical protein